MIFSSIINKTFLAESLLQFKYIIPFEDLIETPESNLILNGAVLIESKLELCADKENTVIKKNIERKIFILINSSWQERSFQKKEY